MTYQFLYRETDPRIDDLFHADEIEAETFDAACQRFEERHAVVEALDPEVKDQDGRLYDVPDALIKAVESGFVYNEVAYDDYN